jgi:hypothetical protein
LSISTGKEALPEGGVLEQEETSYCFYPEPESVGIFL